ncbi:hypothetical protein FPOA_02257 [Fusarium poae]|uniref:HNH nuclease domain-containing protein n=1 Tax=Fusarium poae TaxID=36050 RepID=A0A1B8B6I1_FUSPO|nr:hypothetical protein FPOA_02257 [Fusarium poae]
MNDPIIMDDPITMDDPTITNDPTFTNYPTLTNPPNITDDPISKGRKVFPDDTFFTGHPMDDPTPRIDQLTLSREIPFPSLLASRPAYTLFPIACLEDSMVSDRFRHAKHIQNSIQRFDAKFVIRGEHLATILLAPFASFMMEGYLSHKTHLPQVLQRRLQSISPFCKHYMLYLNPENPEKVEWKHAIPQKVQENLELEDDMSYDQFLLAIHSRSSFVTAKTAVSSPEKGEQGQKKCRARDANVCVITGTPNPSVFWFIPKGWNDSATHNNATGNFLSGCVNLTRINLMDKLHSATELGKTHEVWNMICVDKRLCGFLMEGLCAFKFMGRERLNSETVEVRLQFFWMPELPARFHQPIDLEEGSKKDNTFNYKKVALYPELKDFSDRPCFPMENCKKRSWPQDFSSLPSGLEVSIRMPEQESERFESVVKIHWACVTFTALCGGAGRAWYLTGMNQANGCLEPRYEEFKLDELKMKEEEKKEKKEEKKEKKEKMKALFRRKK